MVSLTHKHFYHKEFSDKPKILSFIDLINGKVNIRVGESANDTDRLYFEMIRAVSVASKKDFELAYNEINRKFPSIESPWLNNNFLIFTIILGVKKFSLNNQWIKTAMEVRKSSNQDFQSLNQTFKNILSDNLNSTDNIFEIIIVYLEVLNLPQLSKEILDRTYLKLSSEVDLFEKHNDFITVISLRAFDVIITTKETPDAVEVTNLKAFKSKFTHRVSIVGDILYGLILIIIVLFVFKYSQQSVEFKDFINDLGGVLSFFGIAIIAGFKIMRKWIKIMLKLLFGYRLYFKD